MSKKEDARKNGLVLAFGSAVLNSLPREVSAEDMKYWVGHQGELAERFLADKVFMRTRNSCSKFVTGTDEQTLFYKEMFGLTVDLSGVKLPPENEVFGWLRVVAWELGSAPLATAIAACRNFFPTDARYLGDEPDKFVLTNDRDPRIRGSYAFRARSRVESDEELRGQSANWDRKCVTATLLERIIMELFHYWKTGEHLDVRNATVCASSRDSDGDVPSCCYSDDNFKIFSTSINLASVYRGPREVFLD